MVKKESLKTFSTLDEPITIKSHARSKVAKRDQHYSGMYVLSHRNQEIIISNNMAKK